MAQDPKILEAKFKKAFSDETFAKKIMTLETPQDVQVMLRTKDIDLSVEEIIKVKDLIVERLAGGGELSDAQLENVSGGVIEYFMIASLFVGGIAAGAMIVGGAWGVNTLSKGSW